MTFDLGGTLRQPWSVWTRPDEMVGLIWEYLVDKGVPVVRDRFLEEMAIIEKSYRERIRATYQEMLIDEKISIALGTFGVELASDDPVLVEAIDKAMESLESVPYPDFEPTMSELVTRNLKLGLITNTSWRLPKDEVENLSRFFSVITTSYEHGFRKPHPSIFLVTLEKLGVSPDNAIHVGDSEADVVGARKVGMKSAFIKRGEKDMVADFVLSSLGDVLEILDIRQS
ncbi:MAG: HAD family hydrolase [Methanobacteriota archaeon]|nr:MAG: HAD family hydrolase [Euryarchaeota archaeon]